jgi:hypothetical protein
LFFHGHQRFSFIQHIVKPGYIYNSGNRMKFFPKKLIVFLSMLWFCLPAKANRDSIPSRVLFTAGFGNYEYLHIGIDKNFLKHARYVEIGAGINPFQFSTTKYVMAYLNLGGYLFEKRKKKRTRWGIHVNNVFWHYSNKYNLFNVYGVGIALKCNYALTKKLEIHGQGGILYNSVLSYERKTFEEVGWPNQWQPSFNIQLKYRLK